MGEMRDSDWSRRNLLRSDWSGPSVAIYTTLVHGIATFFEYYSANNVSNSSHQAVGGIKWFAILLSHEVHHLFGLCVDTTFCQRSI